MAKDPFEIEMELRKDFNALSGKCKELATELLTDFRQQSNKPSLKNPADAPAQYHSTFHGTVQSYLSDLDCDGDW